MLNAISVHTKQTKPYITWAIWLTMWLEWNWNANGHNRKVSLDGHTVSNVSTDMSLQSVFPCIRIQPVGGSMISTNATAMCMNQCME